MFGLSAPVRVDLIKQPTDMRKRFDGLVDLASGSLALVTQAEFHRYRQISLHSFRKHLYQPLPSKTTVLLARTGAENNAFWYPRKSFPSTE